MKKLIENYVKQMKTLEKVEKVYYEPNEMLIQYDKPIFARLLRS